ncbi:MAG TPA: hypothetical protein VER39_04780 [Nocardioidaceae bacterium]|nr:hypothetical protein [Nocardioidaceae bacterium]
MFSAPSCFWLVNSWVHNMLLIPKSDTILGPHVGHPGSTAAALIRSPARARPPTCPPPAI